MKVALILPSYNERENILPLIEKLFLVTKKIKGFEFSYVVVDDNSPDGTGDLVHEFSKHHLQVHLVSGKKEGLGRALLRGIEFGINKLGAEVIAQMDADLSHDPESLPEFFGKFLRGDDFVVGSRYIPGGSIPDNWGLHRKIFSVAGNSVVRFGLGHPQVHDWTGGYRVYHKKYFLEAKNRLKEYGGYVFQIAFLHMSILSGARVGEVPIHFTDRRYGRSKIAPSEYIRNVLLYVGRSLWQRVRHGSFGKFMVVGSIGFTINTIILELMVKSGFSPAAGSALGAECAIISNFILNNAWTFRARKISDGKFQKFLQFNTTSLGALLIQAGTVWVGTNTLGVIWYRWFYVLGVGIGLVWNYTMYSRVIWKK